MQIENTSGQGRLAVVPPEIDRWNWGAFLLNWIWGIGNSTFIALLMFVPFVNIVMAFVLGAKGSIWAWRNRRWGSVEEFQRVQRLWARWAFAIYALFMAAVIALCLAFFTLLRGSQPYKLAKAELAQNAQVQAALGTPLSMGMPTGIIETSGSAGSARLQFGVDGPHGYGTTYVEARKSAGQWELTRLAVEVESTGRRIPIK